MVQQGQRSLGFPQNNANIVRIVPSLCYKEPGRLPKTPLLFTNGEGVVCSDWVVARGGAGLERAPPKAEQRGRSLLNTPQRSRGQDSRGETLSQEAVVRGL